MNKDKILTGIANYINDAKHSSEHAGLVIRPQRSVEPFPPKGTRVVVAADSLTHIVGHLWRLEVCRLRVQTNGIHGRSVAPHQAAMDLCVSCFPSEDPDDEIFTALDAAIRAAEPRARLNFWWVRDQAEQPIEGEAWWEDALEVRIGIIDTAAEA